MIQRLELHWEKLIHETGLEKASCDQIFDDLILKYQATSRHYHNLNHIDNMLTLSSRFEYSIALQWAIWFHDVIYSITSKRNEEKSASYATDTLDKLSVKQHVIDEIARLILLTKSHVTEPKDILGKQLLDLDLSVLSTSSQVYKVYVQQIRKEYNLYPDMVYIPARIKVIQSFLDMETIYQTSAFESLELIAHKNLSLELKSYQS